MWDILIGIALVMIFIGFGVWVYALVCNDLMPKVRRAIFGKNPHDPPLI